MSLEDDRTNLGLLLDESSTTDDDPEYNPETILNRLKECDDAFNANNAVQLSEIPEREDSKKESTEIIAIELNSVVCNEEKFNENVLLEEKEDETMITKESFQSSDSESDIRVSEQVLEQLVKDAADQVTAQHSSSKSTLDSLKIRQAFSDSTLNSADSSNDVVIDVLNTLKKYSSSEGLVSNKYEVHSDVETQLERTRPDTSSSSSDRFDNDQSNCEFILYGDELDGVIVEKRKLETDESKEELELHGLQTEEYNLDDATDDHETLRTSHSGGSDDGRSYTVGIEERLKNLHDELVKVRQQLSDERMWNKAEAERIEYATKQVEATRQINAITAQGSELAPFDQDSCRWSLEELARERVRAKRMVAAMEFQERLGQVEALCSAELNKLEEAIETLEPLNRMMSFWSPLTDYSQSKLSASWMRRDFFMEVTRSMNVSTTQDTLTEDLGMKKELVQ